MASSTDQRIARMAGESALPRKNGELVFSAPWEGRAFGLAVALSDGHHYAWDEFRDQLVAEIARAEANGDPSTYYERWVAALERVVLARNLITPAELDARAAELAEEDD